MALNEIDLKRKVSSEIMSEIKSDLVKEVVDEEELFADIDIVQLVSFTIDEVEYAVEILSVHDILRIPDITRLPNTPDFLRGVINLRGNVIPVVDIKNRFGFSQAKMTHISRIIVTEIAQKLVGILVDHVNQVVRVPDTNINPPSELIDGVSEEFIKGIGRMKDRLIIILKLSDSIYLDESERDND